MDGDKDGILEGSTLRVSFSTPNGIVIGTGKGIILGFNDVELLGSTLGPADGITLGLDEESELNYPDGSFHGSNEVKPEGSLLGA